MSGVKAVGQAAKDVKSVLDANKDKTVNMQSYEPEGDFIGEKIQVGKASPKSPNCIIMPTKDEISDKAKKKTLTGVVTKKQKQLLNQEGRSNWREEITSPTAVQKNINEFAVTGTGLALVAKSKGALGVAKALGWGKALKWGGVAAGTYGAGKAVLGQVGKKATSQHDVGTRKNPS